jgi:hypothetical protein
LCGGFRICSTEKVEIQKMSDSSRSVPRISINKLGEYMTATASRRRRIIQDQKYPPDFQVARYTEAQEAISEFLAAGADDVTILTAAIDRLNGATPKTDWDAQRIELCIEAIESFLDFADYECVEGMTAQVASNDPPKLPIAGVSVSVRPELILRGNDKNSKPTVGAVKLYIGKSNPLTDESAAYITTTVHQYIEEQFARGNAVVYQKCSVVDVFAQQCFSAPKSYIRRRRDVEAGCEEIARAWPVV